MYTVTLAAELVAGNAAGLSPRVNLAALLHGNGCTGTAGEACGVAPGATFATSPEGLELAFLRSHALVGRGAYEGALGACDPSAPIDLYSAGAHGCYVRLPRRAVNTSAGAGGGGGDDDDAWLVAACDEPDCLCLPPGACAEANARLCTPFQMGPACPPR